jgi:hypothetical protein
MILIWYHLIGGGKIMVIIEATVVLGIFAVIAHFLGLTRGRKMSFSGIIIDNLCEKEHNFDLDKYIVTHTKQCALLPYCIGSGFSLVTQGKVYKFSEGSSRKIEHYLKRDDSTLSVDTKVRVREDSSLELISLKNKNK